METGGGALISDGTALFIIDDTRELSPVGDVVGKLYLPQGYVKANGAIVQREDYPRLVNLADKYDLWTDDRVTYPAMFGIGDGNTTFALPDWRGVVSRFADEGKGYDTGRFLGTYQVDLIGSHKHTYTNPCGSRWNGYGVQYENDNDAGHDATQYTSAVGGVETRMKNISVMAVMRY